MKKLNKDAYEYLKKQGMTVTRAESEIFDTTYMEAFLWISDNFKDIYFGLHEYGAVMLCQRNLSRMNNENEIYRSEMSTVEEAIADIIDYIVKKDILSLIRRFNNH